LRRSFAAPARVPIHLIRQLLFRQNSINNATELTRKFLRAAVEHQLAFDAHALLAGSRRSWKACKFWTFSGWTPAPPEVERAGLALAVSLR